MTRSAGGPVQSGNPAQSNANRQAAFEKVQKDLGGLWFGTKGETYEVLFEGETWRSSAWTCVRKNGFGSTPYTLRWDGNDCVIWGTDYTLLVSELRRSPNHPTWHSAKGKRPFVWGRAAGDVIRFESKPATLPSAHVCPSVHVSPSVRVTSNLPSANVEEKSWSPQKQDAWARDKKFLTTAVDEIWTALKEDPDATDGEPSPAESANSPTTEGEAHSAKSAARKGPSSPEVNTDAAAAAASALLRRLSLNQADQNASPQGGGEHQKQQGEHHAPRPPPPHVRPFEAELKILAQIAAEHMECRPPPPGADDTDPDDAFGFPGAGLGHKPGLQALPIGAAVRALFFGDWHDGTVRQMQGEMVEVLWDAEYSMSYIPLADVQLKETAHHHLYKAEGAAHFLGHGGAGGRSYGHGC